MKSSVRKMGKGRNPNAEIPKPEDDSRLRRNARDWNFDLIRDSSFVTSDLFIYSRKPAENQNPSLFGTGLQKCVPAALRAARVSLFRGLRGLFLRFAFGFFFFRFGFGSRFRRGRFDGERHIHPFENSALAGIALALIEAHNAGVTATALFLRRSDLIEENLHN